MLTSIRTRILFACITIIVVSLGINTAVNYRVADKFNEKTLTENLDAILTGHETGIEEWVRSKTQMVVSVEDAALMPEPLPALKQVAAAGDFINLYAGYADKSSQFSDRTGIPANYDPTQRPWYKRAVEAGRPVVTAYVAISTGKPLVAFAAPIVRDGAMRGVVSGDVSMDSVIANVKSIRPTPSSFGLIVDRTGNIIAHQDPKLILKPVTEIFSDVTAEQIQASAIEGASPIEVHVGDSAKLLKARAIAGTTWLTVVVLDKAEATAGTRSLLLGSIIALAILVTCATLLIGAVTSASLKGLAKIRDAMQAIGSGDGDLTQRLPVPGKDEVSQFAESFNVFVNKIDQIIGRIYASSESVRHAANEIAAGNLDLSKRTEAAAANLEETAASMEQITATVRNSASSTQQANQIAHRAANAASSGSAVVDNVVSTMSNIETASQKISQIIGVIEGIAFQTNILALNAAVEAARAGEDGRGFAVVAGEVRTLAQRSAQAAKEIKDLINENVASVTLGASLVDEAGNKMREIVGNVSGVSEMMAEITRASDEQTRGIHEVNGAVTQLDEMVQQNAALVEESAAAASTLQIQAHELALAVGQFRSTQATN